MALSMEPRLLNAEADVGGVEREFLNMETDFL
jgi:hypothetical protein